MSENVPHEATDISCQQFIASLFLLKQSVIADRDYNMHTDDSYDDEDFERVEAYIIQIERTIAQVRVLLPIVP